MTFSALGLSDPILKALHEQAYETPSPIQAQAIPAILDGKDVMAAAQTGTGKTAAFTLPILSRLSKGERARPHEVRALILTPTRELAAQVSNSVATYGKHLSLRTAVVFGGVKINPQLTALRRGVDILVATPGRLMDLYEQKAMDFSQLEVLVLDEADRMLDMGFIHDIRKIMAILPRKRQNLMFSATFSNGIRTLAKGLMQNPVEISVSPPNTTVKSVEQWVYPVDKKQKTALLSHLIWEGRWEQVLVFTKTKHGANRLSEYLEKDGIKSVAIHGNKSQGARTKALANFKDGSIRALVATDIAARGLDIELLPNVVNFDLPHVPEDYVHRIGRTGRAGATGQAISLVSADEIGQLRDIERIINKTITRKVADGFEPSHDVPKSDASTAPRRPNNHSRQAKKPGGAGRSNNSDPRQRPGKNARRFSKGKPSGATTFAR
ncbi:MAG: ATP-dependent RNA helicase [Gammaproteobacteria bacterium RIFCSPHIGHO2_12_FULL_40_19]|nr:MAG: ATP-dependent RNA helicase [Gammaproteobacteria bacterium RIFCSPHIGHO2_12_FULL_40_19]